MIWSLVVVSRCVSRRIAVVPGADLWPGIPIPDDNEFLPFSINFRETLFTDDGDSEGTYLSDNRILTGMLEQISYKDRSYEQIQKFVVWTVNEHRNRRYVPASREKLKVFPGPAQLFDRLKSHPTFVQHNSRVDIDLIFLLFVVRTAQDKGLMNTDEGVPFSEVASNLLDDIDAFLAQTAQTKALKENTREILGSISQSCGQLSEELEELDGKKELPVSFCECFQNRLSAAGLDEKLKSLKDAFDVFCSLMNQEFNCSLADARREQLVYSIARNYRILRTMIGCFIHAKPEMKGSSAAMCREFGQMLARLGVDLLMYSLDYDVNYKYIEDIVFSCGYPVRKRSLGEKVKGLFDEGAQAKPIAWKDAVVGKPQVSAPADKDDCSPDQAQPAGEDYCSQIQLLLDLFGLIKIFNPAAPERLHSLGELNDMVKSAQGRKHSCLLGPCCGLPQLAAGGLGRAVLSGRHDELWTAIKRSGLEMERAELVKTKHRMALATALALAFTLMSGAYAIFLTSKRAKSMEDPPSQ